MMPLEFLRWLTQYNKSISLMEDKADELASFWGKDRQSVIDRYKALNVTREVRAPGDLFSSEDHESVTESYINSVFLGQSLTRLRLHYTRLGLAHRIISETLRFRPVLAGLRVLDYGCGAADYSLAFAALGGEGHCVRFRGRASRICFTSI